MSDRINWIHLSDFHVGMDDYGQRKLFSEIVDYVEEEVRKGRKFDLVFITGDIADRGRPAQYEEFLEKFLVPLNDALGPGWSGSIFTVPGNHDVDRDEAQYFEPMHILSTDSHFFDPTNEGRRKRSQFFPRFDAYTKGVTNWTKAPAGWLESDQGIYDVCVPTSAGHVLVVGVNTAWLSKDNNDRHRLAVGVDAIEDALNRHPQAQLRIVLGHHPFNWLDDEAALRLQSLFASRNVVYLCGHLHKNDVRYEDGGTGAFLALRSGAAFQGRSEDIPGWVNGFQTAEISTATNELTIFPVHWAAGHRQWRLVATHL